MQMLSGIKMDKIKVELKGYGGTHHFSFWVMSFGYVVRGTLSFLQILGALY